MNDSNWLDKEIENLNASKPEVMNYPEPLKLIENKLTEFEVDFSNAFEKKPNKINANVLQALIPCKVGDEHKVFWLNVRNPLYSEICNRGKIGQTKFKILRTGKQKDTIYTIVD